MTSSEVESISAELPDPLLERPIPRPSRSSSDPSPLAKNHAYFGAGTKGSNPPCSSGESGELPYCACSPRVRRRCHLVIPHRAIVPLRSLHRRRLGPCCASAAAQPFHLLERARPVSAQQARQCTVGEEPPTGLAARAVVCLVVRVGNPRDRRPASRARFSVPSVDRHAFVKGGHFLGEAFAGFAPKTLGPFEQRPPRRVEEPLHLIFR